MSRWSCTGHEIFLPEVQILFPFFDVCRKALRSLAFRTERVAERTDATTSHDYNNDIVIRFAFAENFPRLLRAGDILDEHDWAEISAQRNRELRRRAIATRVLLRKSLSELVNHQVQTSQWCFGRTSYGKLIIVDDQPQVYFSISHTRGASVIVLSKFKPVGIDIEVFDSEVDNDALKTGLSRRERVTVGRLKSHKRSRACLRLWTLKEAYTKLIGVGLAAHLPSLEFLLEPVRLSKYCEAAGHGCGTRFKSWFTESQNGAFCVGLAVAATAHA